MHTSAHKYLLMSVIFHISILLLLIVGYHFTTPLAVVENTNKQDVISAVVLGDTPKSHILPKEIKKEPAPPLPEKVVEEIQESPPVAIKKSPPPTKAVIPENILQEKAIALKLAEKKKIAQQKTELQKKQVALEKEFLADIKKQKMQQKKQQQKVLQKKFDKMLKQQAEQSLRQQLLNEDIKLRGLQNRQAQGEVNKYKALIVQSISEHWVVPSDANKKLSSELMIRLSPAGVVLEVEITKTSGNLALDRSARAAVLKASPLPVPKDPLAFAAFRKFVLKVKPENILANG